MNHQLLGRWSAISTIVPPFFLSMLILSKLNGYRHVLIHSETCSVPSLKHIHLYSPMPAPWCSMYGIFTNIQPQNELVIKAKYSSTMEHMGYGKVVYGSFLKKAIPNSPWLFQFPFFFWWLGWFGVPLWRNHYHLLSTSMIIIHKCLFIYP